MHVTSTLTAWRSSDVPVVGGPRPERTWAVADLADADLCRALVDWCAPLTSSAKAAALMPLHWAAWCAVELLVAPLAHDGVELQAEPDQLGLTIDDDLAATGMWIGDADIRDDDVVPERVGSHLWTILQPVTEVSRSRGRISRRVIDAVALDAITGNVRRLERTTPRTVAPVDWAARLLATAASVTAAAPPPPDLLVSPDAGPLVTMPAARVCCVLSSRLTAHACPGCPLVGEVPARCDHVAAWLQDLDDATFRSVAGRARRHAVH